jgi:hypothetical protein
MKVKQLTDSRDNGDDVIKAAGITGWNRHEFDGKVKKARANDPCLNDLM